MQYDLKTLTDTNGSVLIKSFFSAVPTGKRAYREHHHTECEISTFISGTGTYTVNGKDYDFKEGDVFLFRGDEPHCITDIKTEFKLLNIQFDPKVLWQRTDDLTALKIFFARGRDFENLINRDNLCTDTIRKIILEISDEMSQKKEGFETISKSLITKALILLVREYGYTTDDTEYAGLKRSIPHMESALRYINENLDKQLTLESIAEKAALSPAYFSGIFKKLNGITPWEYITIKRVEKAIELLKTTDNTKLDIAFRCGFNSSSNFYKAFLRVTGKKPSSFKK